MLHQVNERVFVDGRPGIIHRVFDDGATVTVEHYSPRTQLSEFFTGYVTNEHLVHRTILCKGFGEVE